MNGPEDEDSEPDDQSMISVTTSQDTIVSMASSQSQSRPRSPVRFPQAVMKIPSLRTFGPITNAEMEEVIRRTPTLAPRDRGLVLMWFKSYVASQLGLHQ